MGNGHRNWMGVVWEDQLDPKFLDNFIEQGIRGFAIRHDQDTLDNGTVKKPHWHILSVFSGAKSYNQMLDLYKRCCGDKAVNTVQFRDDIGGAARYLCHLGYPDKHEYKPDEVICINGTDYVEAVTQLSDLRIYDMQIKKFISEHHIKYFNVLSDYGTFVNQEWKTCIDGRAVFWVKYLASYAMSCTDTSIDPDILALIDQCKFEKE